MIRLDDAARRYGPTWALRGVTLEVPPGEAHALVGPNGAGKTTALRLLATLEAPTAGTAAVDGRRTRDDPAGVRQRIGYLGHDPPAYEALTPREHLAFDARARMGDAGAEAVDDLLAALDLPAGTPAGQLSRGTLRRLGLARALVGAPRALLLDEPFATLDPAARRDARALVADPEAPRAVLLAAHDLEAAAEAADALHVLREGRLVETVEADDPHRARDRARTLLEGSP